MKSSLASTITRKASKQTYYTIRFLVDPPRIADAYRAYAYFRWVDDILDAETSGTNDWGDGERSRRIRFLDRQEALLEQCLAGDAPQANEHETMLIELVRHAQPGDIGLDAYLRNMMLVMDFDVRRRGRLVSQAELNDYTRSLAIAVTEAMHHFIGNGDRAPHDEGRYLAVSGAHILHMLRDTYVDMRAGYFNVPREFLETHSIGPRAVHSDAYREWVADRVDLARSYLDAGRTYFSAVKCRRHRLAGLAYIARFQWLIETLERDQFNVRPEYRERSMLASGLRTGSQVVRWIIGPQARSTVPTPIVSSRSGRA